MGAEEATAEEAAVAVAAGAAVSPEVEIVADSATTLAAEATSAADAVVETSGAAVEVETFAAAEEEGGAERRCRSTREFDARMPRPALALTLGSGPPTVPFPLPMLVSRRPRTPFRRPLLIHTGLSA